jgi:GAF domain-containing protein
MSLHQPKLAAQEIDKAWTALLTAIEQFPTAGGIDDVRRIVCRGARELCGADGVSFILREGDLCRYVEDDAVSPLWKGQDFAMHACISGWCMLNKQTVVIEDIYQDARVPHDAYRPTFVKSLVMVPVPLENPIAAIGVYWATQQKPLPYTVLMLESLARSTGSSIMAAQRVGDAQRR